ncbi:MAG: BMP family ABC transporter substrate-binding protein [Pseudomonadota bacterium]
MAAKHSPEKDALMGMTYGVGHRSSSRRAFFSCVGLLLSAASLLNCSKKSDAAATPAPAASGSAAAAPAPQKQFTAGFIYVGSKSDYGYNQAHAEGAKTLTSQGVKIREEENVPETLDVQKTMESMINLDGASVLFPTSFGYFDPHILKMAEKYPNVIFLHCGGMYTEGKHPKNVGSYFGYIDEAQYVAGIVAGMTTKTNKLGFVAAKPIPQVLRNINSYTLGARSVNPKVTLSVIFTGDWSMPVKEAEASNSLIDQGADVLSSHVDSPKVVIETAERRGAFSTGYHASQAALAPKGYLTGAEWNWETVYKYYVEKIQKGEPFEHLLRGGFKEGFIKMSAYGPAVSDAAKAKADEAKKKFMDGTLLIYSGPLKDNAGKEVIPAGVQMAQRDIKLEGMGYLVDGVKGSVH